MNKYWVIIYAHTDAIYTTSMRNHKFVCVY